MRKVFILNSVFYKLDGKSLSIGGIETYIYMLCNLIKKNNMIPIVYQYGNNRFQRIYDNIEVNGIPIKSKWSTQKKSKVLFSECKKNYDKEQDIIIFATDLMGIKNKEKNVIGIQHGIFWDIRTQKCSHTKNLIYFFIKSFHALKTISRINRFNYLVAVDYNFLNWYRTQIGYIETKIRVIPNCTNVINFDKEKTNDINIIFARRFVEYRGTKLFASIVEDILNIDNNVNITFAGEGPDEEFLINKFKNNSRVKFIKYNSENSIEVHKKYQIAVVPTIGSEGTSLSLLEAMSAKCAVIATNVGGMTNIILDHYNGLLVNPEKDELYNALSLLITNKSLREMLSENAYESVSKSFNKVIWEERWTNVFNEIK